VLAGPLILDDAKENPGVNRPEQKATSSSGSEVRIDRARPAGESSQAPADETAPSQKAHDSTSTGKEEVKLNAEPPGSSRPGVHEAGQKLSSVRAETRVPELARTLVDQVVRAFQLEVKGPVSEMRLKLEPETLGELALRVRVEEGKMQARIEVSQPAVKAIIEGNLPQLRQALATQGIQMDRIDIATQDRSLSRGHSDGSDARDRRQTGKDAEAPLQDAPLQSVRMLGYNTIELTM
jgi:flagellar hook-length control protein FliK